MGRSANTDSYLPLQIFAKSLNLIEQNYPENVDREKLISNAIQGMLLELDPYSYLMSPSQIQSFNRYNQNHFGGMGIEVAFKNKHIMVTSVLPHSGALDQGVKLGDIITHVNGEEIKHLPFDLATQKMKGKIGTTIKISVKRLHQAKPIHFNIPLRKIKIPSITSQWIADGLFYARISAFKESTFREFKAMLLRPHRRLFKKKCKIGNHRLCSEVNRGLLLDLRQNSGGVVNQALLIADLLIDKGILITTKGKIDDYNQVFNAKDIGTFAPIPIVVLIDSYSASASEILAVSLKENNRALLVGETSFGKGSIQSIFPLDKGYALKLTVSHYYTPKNNFIEGVGVRPSITLKPKTKFRLLKEHQETIQQFQTQFNKQYHSANWLKSQPMQQKKSITFSKLWNKRIQTDLPLQAASMILQQLAL